MAFSNMLQAFFYFMMFPLIFLSICFFLYNLNNGIYVCMDVCKLCARCGACTYNSEIKSLSTEPARGPFKFLKFFEEDNIPWLKNLETIQRISMKNLLPSFLIFFLLYFQSLQITSALLDRVFQSFFIYMQIKMNIFIFFLFVHVVY